MVSLGKKEEKRGKEKKGKEEGFGESLQAFL
jgi:hypothetical protein